MHWDAARDSGLIGLAGTACAALLGAALLRYRRLVPFTDWFSPAVVFPALYAALFGTALVTLSLDIGYFHRAGVTPRLLLYVVLGLAAFLLGLLAARAGAARRRGPPGPPGVEWSEKRLSRLALVVLAVGVTGFVVYWGLLVGIPLLAAGDEVRHAERPHTYGVGVLFLWLQGSACVYGTHLARELKLRRRIPPMSAAVVGVAFALSALTSYRWAALLQLLVPVIAYQYVGGLRRIRLTPGVVVRFLLLAAVVIGFLGVMGYRRASKNEAKYFRGLELMHIPVELRHVAPAFLTLQSAPASFAYVIEMVPERFAYTKGRFLLAQVPGIGLVIPSLEEDNVSVFITDDIFGMNYRSGHGATAMSVLGNFYMDAGLPLILAGMALLGFAAGRLYLAALRDGGLLHVMVYSFFLATASKWIYSGLFAGDLQLLVLALVTAVLVRPRGPAVRPGPASSPAYPEPAAARPPP